MVAALTLEGKSGLQEYALQDLPMNWGYTW